jgi:hypothetical protein
MAFSKKPKLCTNAPAGLQQINGLTDNLESLRTELETEHTGVFVEPEETVAQVEPGGFEPGFGTIDVDAAHPGAHDSPLIPRGAAYIQQTTDAGSATTVRMYFREGCIQSMQIVSTGVYFFPIDGFAAVWGRATPYGSDVVPALDVKVTTATPDDELGTGLIVRTYMKQTAGSGVIGLFAYHTGFYLLAYGRRTPATAAALTAPRPPSRFAAGPRGGPVRFPRPPRR